MGNDKLSGTPSLSPKVEIEEALNIILFLLPFFAALQGWREGAGG